MNHDVPLRTRERAAVEVARAALRRIAQLNWQEEAGSRAYLLAEEALENIARVLGERQ